MLVGDFNLHYISWPESPSTTPVNNGGCANAEDLCELVGDNFLHKFIEGSSHGAGNKLDLLFCKNAEKLCDVLTFTSDEHNFPTEYHIIEFSIRMKFTKIKRLSLTTTKPTSPHYVESCQKQSWTYPLRITWMNAGSSRGAYSHLP